VILVSAALVLAAIILLIAGVVLATPFLVMWSIVISALAAVCLLIGVLLRRHELFPAGGRTAGQAPASPQGTSVASFAPQGVLPVGVALGGAPPMASPVAVAQPGTQPPSAPPGRLQAAAPTLRPVAHDGRGLAPDAIVVVIPGRRRFHLPSCRQVVGRQVEELTHEEAREEGFTPCTACLAEISAHAAEAREADGRGATAVTPPTGRERPADETGPPDRAAEPGGSSRPGQTGHGPREKADEAASPEKVSPEAETGTAREDRSAPDDGGDQATAETRVTAAGDAPVTGGTTAGSAQAEPSAAPREAAAAEPGAFSWFRPNATTAARPSAEKQASGAPADAEATDAATPAAPDPEQAGGGPEEPGDAPDATAQPDRPTNEAAAAAAGETPGTSRPVTRPDGGQSAEQAAEPVAGQPGTGDPGTYDEADDTAVIPAIARPPARPAQDRDGQGAPPRAGGGTGPRQDDRPTSDDAGPSAEAASPSSPKPAEPAHEPGRPADGTEPAGSPGSEPTGSVDPASDAPEAPHRSEDASEESRPSGQAEDEPAAGRDRLAPGTRVTVMIGTRRYHSTDCPLIKGMGADGVQTMTVEEAEQAGLTHCSVCQNA